MREITRRQVLTTTSPAGRHISSAVVVALPALREAIVARLRTMPGVEVHASAASRIVITIEGPTSGMLGETLNGISMLEGVISANMVFEHVDAQEKARS